MVEDVRKYDHNELSVNKKGSDPEMVVYEVKMKKCVVEGNDSSFDFEEPTEIERTDMKKYDRIMINKYLYERGIFMKGVWADFQKAHFNNEL